MKPLIHFFAAVLFCAHPLFPQSSPLDSTLRAIQSRYQVVGMSVVVSAPDSALFNGSYGLRDVGRNLPVTGTTMFRIASISKMITATALMTLYDQGLCNLDADVSRYLGFQLRNPSFPADSISLRKLLSHTSSLRDGSGYDGFLSLTASQNPPPAVQSLLVSGGASYTTDMWSASRGPASGYFEYANINFGVIGTVIERLSGVRFDIYVRTKVLAPLGIAGSFNIQDIQNINDVAVLYRKSGSTWVPQTDNYGGVKPAPRNLTGYTIGTNGIIFSPTGGLRISGGDLAKLMRMYMNKGILNNVRIIADSSATLMLKPVWTYNGSNGNNYYGIFNTYCIGSHRTTNLLPGQTLIGHPGEAYGLISDMYFEQSGRYGIVFIINGGVYGAGTYSGWYNVEEEAYKAAYKYLPGLLPSGTDGGAIPDRKFELNDNYPNPFNPVTNIEYGVGSRESGAAGREFVSLKVYDMLGKEVATLVNEEKAAGSYEVKFDASGLSSGVYYYSLRAGNVSLTKKLVYMK